MPPLFEAVSACFRGRRRPRLQPCAAQVFERSGAGATLEVNHPFRSVRDSRHLRSILSGRFDRRQSPIELRRGPRFRSAFTGSHPLNCAPSSLVPGLGTHRCVHVVTLRGGRTGRSEARSAHRHAAANWPRQAGPGPRSGSATQWCRSFGPPRGSRHTTAHHPLGRGRGILAAAAPQAAYPLSRLGLPVALGEPEGWLAHY
jgi:hypothetical protein